MVGHLNRATIELIKLLLDGEWHSTNYLGGLAGDYVRPEVAWRKAQRRGESRVGSIQRGRNKVIRDVLNSWWKQGKVERRLNGRMAYWRVVDLDWTKDYLKGEG